MAPYMTPPPGSDGPEGGKGISTSSSIPPGWTCVEWTPVGRGKLVGTCVLELPSGLRIASVVIAGQDGSPWVTPARTCYTDGDGRKHYTDIVTWCSPERRRAWYEAALATVRPHLAAPPAREEAPDGYASF